MSCRKGVILKGIGGFYYVSTEDGIYECKARGNFRKNNLKPYIGDNVIISIADEGYNSIEEIIPRRNCLIRPPISNIDQLIIVSSIVNPTPNTVVIDKLISISYYNNIKPILVVSKTDLGDANDIVRIYESAGIETILTSKYDKESHERIKKLLPLKVTAFTGNSGVGKSTLLNCIDENLLLETGDISQKLKRGKHTTRHVELYPLEGGGYIADTPGFSSIDLSKFNIIDKNEIKFTFKDFAPYMNECKFSSCNHIGEKGCAVIKAVNDGHINKSRYNSYLNIYNEIKDIKSWKR